MTFLKRIIQGLRIAFPGNLAAAGGAGAAAIGGNADQSIVVTGDNARINVGDGNQEPDHPTRAHQLGPDLSDFVGRDDEISALTDQLSGAGGAASISALAGLGGIGKSALAVHIAYDLVEHYPDGQLMLELGGTGDNPASPVDVMGRVILSVHPTAHLPDDEETVTATYRDLLSGGKYLLVLDNAHDANQVRNLLPPLPSAAIITSRQPIVLPNVKAYPLDELSAEEARTLLREITGEDRVTDDDLDRIAVACGFLPLALRVAGTFLAVHPTWTIDEYLSRLENERTRFTALKIPEYELDVAQVLGLSVAQLERDNAPLVRNWRKLSVFAGDFDRWAVASVWDCTDEEARDGLDALLHRAMTLYDSETGRHLLHDLMRDMARLEEKEGDYTGLLYEASARHAVHYVGILSEADGLYMNGDDDVLEGLKLYDLEGENIQAGHDWAVAHMEDGGGAARLCFGYTDAGVYVLSLRQHPRENIAWLEAGIAGARAVGELQVEGTALGNLGLAWARLGNARKAIEYYEQHLTITRETSDRLGEGNALGNLGVAWAALGEVRKAIEYYEQNLTIARETGDRRGEGNSLGNLGVAWAALGDGRKAIEYYEQHLTIAREMGDRLGEANALGNLGNAWAALGEVRKAIGYYEQQLTIARETGDRRGEGSVLGNLGAAWTDLGEVRKAIEYNEQHLTIARETGARRGEGNALGNLGVAWSALGEVRKAIGYYEQHLTIAREIGDRHGEGAALGNLGNTWIALGDGHKAIEYFEQHLTIAREIGDRQGEGIALFSSAISLKRLGQIAEAATFAQAALEIFTEIESPRAETVRKWLEAS
ncbi:MAG: tetratricopeptide repeat protein [Rhodospirillaceae bacterium]|nr:tetratricopeptide repeat protein [Rhodospirillaceae bacterium]